MLERVVCGQFEHTRTGNEDVRALAPRFPSRKSTRSIFINYPLRNYSINKSLLRPPMAPVSLMPFLRPLPLPRPNSISLLQRQISNQPHLYRPGKGLPLIRQRVQCSSADRTLPAAAVRLPLKTETPKSAPPAIKPSAQGDAAALSPLPYHVHRTASQKLPIYHLAKRGGNLHQTRIRKIEGDVGKLREELVASLALKEETVVINRLTGHIIIKVRRQVLVRGAGQEGKKTSS